MILETVNRTISWEISCEVAGLLANKIQATKLSKDFPRILQELYVF